MLYTLENDFLTLCVNSSGGSMTSLIYKPTCEERLHQSDEWWKGQDVVIFPIIGHAGGFEAKGKSCLLKSHGLARYAELSVAGRGEDFITLAFSSDADTLKEFPYEFYFEVGYRLCGNSVEVSYFVQSKGGVLPFYVGGHPALYTPGGYANICFEKEEQPLLYPLDGSGAKPVGKIKSFVADKAFFKRHKTCQLGSLSGGAVFADTADGYRYTYRSDCPLYAFWSNENGGDYVCVEPWWGINDFDGAPKEITLKPFMNFDRGEGSRFVYTLSVEKL